MSHPNSGQTLDNSGQAEITVNSTLDNSGHAEMATLDNSGQAEPRRRGPHPYGVCAGTRVGAYAHVRARGACGD